MIQLGAGAFPECLPSRKCQLIVLVNNWKPVWWLYPSARLAYKTSIFRFVAVAFKSDSANEHKPWRRMTCSSYFKAVPQIEQLPHLNQSCEWSAVFFFFIFGGTIIDQRSLLVGHLSIQALLKTLTKLEHLTQSWLLRPSVRLASFYWWLFSAVWSRSTPW